MVQLRKIILTMVAFLLVFMLTLLPFASDIVFATNNKSDEYTLLIHNYLTDFVETSSGEENKTRNGRFPGTEAEFNAAMYIKNKMDLFTNFQPVNNASTVDGVESFEFIDDFNGNKSRSQNLIYRRDALLQTDKKIILCTHYDSAYLPIEKNSDGYVTLVTDAINDSAASVATLLAVVDTLDKEYVDPGFNIEVVFFGASTNSFAGSDYYLRGVDDKAAENIILTINIDKIALGTYNYFYVNEFVTSQETYLSSILADEFGFKKLNVANVSHLNDENVNGLNYTHIGLESDNSLFVSRNINTLNIFSGDYEKYCIGRNEYNNIDNVTYTKNDNYIYIFSKYQNININLVNVCEAVNNIVHDTDLSYQMQKGNNLSSDYAFWTNSKLACFLVGSMFIVFVFVWYMIYLYLKNKSKKALSDGHLDQLVINIAKNIGNSEDIENLIDEKVKKDIDLSDQDKENKNE